MSTTLDNPSTQPNSPAPPSAPRPSPPPYPWPPSSAIAAVSRRLSIHIPSRSSDPHAPPPSPRDRYPHPSVPAPSPATPALSPAPSMHEQPLSESPDATHRTSTRGPSFSLAPAVVTPDDSDSDSDSPRPARRRPQRDLERTQRTPRKQRSASRWKHEVSEWADRINPALTLENTGSVARDHLAAERTFLAYVRTSLAIASTGVALVQLFTISANRSNSNGMSSHLQRFARPLGATVVVMGFFTLLIGSTRYFRIQHALIAGYFPPARQTVTFMTAVLALLVAIVFSILVAVPR